MDLISGQVRAQASEYNGQIARGEDVISRIIFAGKNGGEELRRRVLDTINNLLELACKRVKMPQGRVTPDQVVKMTIAGNSSMIHLLLGIPAGRIRLSPFITAVNQASLMTGREVGVNINPDATVDCLPGVASYVGGDITAGVLSSGLEKAENVTLFHERVWCRDCARDFPQREPANLYTIQFSIGQFPGLSCKPQWK